VIAVRNFRTAVYSALAVAICLGMALAVSAQAAQSSVRHANSKGIAVSLNVQTNSVIFTVKTAPSASVSVGLGTDTTNLIPKNDPGKKTIHKITISPLAPMTHYFYRVRAVNSKGKATTKGGQFTTAPMLRPTLSASGNNFLLNGMKTYVIMAQAFNECPSQRVVSDDVSMGVQFLYHKSWDGCPDNNHQDTWLTADALHALLGGQVGWIQDGPRASGSNSLPSWDTLPELVNLQTSLTIDNSSVELESCGAQWDTAVPLYNRLASAAQSHPVIYQVFATATVGPNHNCLSPKNVTAMFWAPVLAKVDGIEYLTQHYALPTDTVDVSNDVKSAALLQAQRLAALYPCLFGGKNIAAASTNADVKVMASKWGGGTCVAALNLVDQPQHATVRVGRRSGIASVAWEHRKIAFKAGTFNDRFGPYQLHVYYFTGS
jgi:hypothetical protein